MKAAKFFFANVLPLLFSLALYTLSLGLFGHACEYDHKAIMVLTVIFSALPLFAIIYFAVELQKRIK